LSAEKDFRKLNLSIVRFGNVFGSDGSVARLFFDQLLHNKPITLTSIKAKRFFMSIKEACNLVIETSDLKYKNSIYVLKMGKQIKIIDLVKKMSSVLGVDFNKITITGLKKGEKRIEKLSYKNLFSTSKKDIMIAKDPIYNKKDVIYFTNSLMKYLNVFDKKKCVKFLKYFVNNHEKFKK
jgi:FlaA1/EpsC-like NDP-sugar epimerase